MRGETYKDEKWVKWVTSYDKETIDKERVVPAAAVEAGGRLWPGRKMAMTSRGLLLSVSQIIV